MATQRSTEVFRFNGPTTFTGSTPAKPRSSVIVITKNDGGEIGS